MARSVQALKTVNVRKQWLTLPGPCMQLCRKGTMSNRTALSCGTVRVQSQEHFCSPERAGCSLSGTPKQVDLTHPVGAPFLKHINSIQEKVMPWLAALAFGESQAPGFWGIKGFYDGELGSTGMVAPRHTHRLIHLCVLWKSHQMSHKEEGPCKVCF